MTVTIKKVASRRDLRKFIKFPFSLYQDNPYWVPALTGDEFDTFNKKKNAAFEYCEADCFLAYKDDKLAGRVAAIINHEANKRWGEEVVRFGWLDFIEDVEVLSKLIDAVAEWGKQRGCTTIKGPWGFTDMDKEGSLVEGYDKLSSFTCLYNFPYYDTLLKQIGFERDADWTQRIVYIPDKPLPSYQYVPLIEKKFGVHCATGKSMQDLNKRYGMEIFHLYNESFAPLFEFAPLTDEQIRRYLKTYIPILDMDFISVVVNEEDKPVGFCFCVPTLSTAVKKSNGNLLPFGFIRILKALKHNDTLESLLIGVLPEYQGKGVNLLMFKQLHENCIKRGVKRMIMNPQLEENVKVQSLFDEFETELYTVRRAYVKPLK